MGADGERWEVLDDLNEEEVNEIVQVLNRMNTPKDLQDQLKKLSDSKHQADNRTQFSFSQDWLVQDIEQSNNDEVRTEKANQVSDG